MEVADSSEIFKVEDLNSDETPPAPELSLLKYAHHLHYARSYDAEWAAYCERISAFLWPNEISVMSHGNITKIEKFPNDIIMIILSYFDARSLCSIAMTCRLFHEYASDEEYWESLLVAKFNFKASQCTIEPFQGSKQIYRTVALTVRNLFRGNNNGTHPGFRSNSLVWAMHG